jgi:hypothetical protein
MRIVFGFGSNLFFWEGSFKRAQMRTNSSSGDEEGEEFEQPPPVDPHGTLSAHMEISPTAVYMGDSAERKFGFGSEKPGGKEG